MIFLLTPAKTSIQDLELVKETLQPHGAIIVAQRGVEQVNPQNPDVNLALGNFTAADWESARERIDTISMGRGLYDYFVNCTAPIHAYVFTTEDSSELRFGPVRTANITMIAENWQTSYGSYIPVDPLLTLDEFLKLVNKK